jgi:CO/xanthine dehydrogenase Mo-binding subunit
MGDYYRKWAAYELLRFHRKEKSNREAGEAFRGIGIANAWQGNGFLYTGSDKGLYSVELTLDKEGSLEIHTSMVTSDMAYAHIWGKIASEILSIDAGRVRIDSGDTMKGPDSGPASLSRNVTVLTKLVENACLAIRKQRFRDPLPITVRRSCRPLKSPGWGGKAPGPGSAARLFDKNSLSRLSWGAAVVEVEIDPIGFSPKIRGAWLAVDGGRILSENRARRSLRASVIQALSWASGERLEYAGGIIGREQFMAYDIPGPAGAVPIKVDFLWNDTAEPKGIGELAMNCLPAAYVQAVSQAADHPFESIPLGPADVWEALKSKDREFSK